MTTHTKDGATPPITDDRLLSDWDPDKFDPVNLSASIASAGYTWAEADGAAKLKDSAQDKFKSKIILEYIAGRRVDSYAKVDEVKIKAMSVERAKLLVEQDEEYLNAVKDGISARTTANKLRVRYDMARAMLDGLRSKEATHRALTTMR